MDRVLLPKSAKSVHYHALYCDNLDRSRAAEVAREDAEDLGRRPAACVRRIEPGTDDDPGKEVPA